MQTEVNINNPEVIGQYTLKHRCGQGAYGDVYWAKDNILGRDVALKRIYKKNQSCDLWKREFDGLKNYCNNGISNNFLLHIYHVDENEDFFYYTMELADNISDNDQNFVPDTLAERLQNGRLSIDQACKITQQLLNGLQDLHNNGLIHRDVKPENIVFVNRTPKLSDIGLVSFIDTTRSISGTMGYIPPEVISAAASSGKYKFSQQSDLYALGKVLYCIATGYSPEKYPSIPFELHKNYEMKKINQILEKACNRNHKKRFQSTAEFLEAFKADFSSSAVNITNTRLLKKILLGIVLTLIIASLVYLFTAENAEKNASPKSSSSNKDIQSSNHIINKDENNTKRHIVYPQPGSFATKTKPEDDF